MTFFTLPHEEAALRELTSFAARDREGFRIEASNAYHAYSKEDRAQIKQLETPLTTAYDVLTAWKTTLQPLATELRAQRLKPTFSKTIAKYLALTDDEAENKADTLIDDRLNEARKQVVTKLYSRSLEGKNDITAAARAHASQLLKKPEAQLHSLHERYIAYALHHNVARLHMIDVVDSHANWWKRYITARRIEKERKNTFKTEENRLHVIDTRLSELSLHHDGLIGAITQKWDVMTIFSLRQQYEKQLRTLSSTDDGAQRLALFEKTIKSFRDTQLNASPSLAVAYIEAEATSSLLLALFELPNTEKNQLLLTMKEVRELTEEKTKLLEARDHRRQLLQ